MYCSARVSVLFDCQRPSRLIGDHSKWLSHILVTIALFVKHKICGQHSDLCAQQSYSGHRNEKCRPSWVQLLVRTVN